MSRDDGSTAIHEAAHAVAALTERVALHSATIIPTEHAEGTTLHRNILHGRDIECEPSTVNRLRMERLVRVLLAGPAASERIGEESRATIHDGDDESKAFELISYFTGSDKETEAYYGLLWVQAQQGLEKPGVWAMVMAVADALVIAKTLRGIQLRTIARQAFRDAIRTEHERLLDDDTKQSTR